MTHTMLLTMVTAISAGAYLIVLSRRLGVSAIVLLLAGGVLLGPEGLGIVDPNALGDGLHVLVPLAVGLILFEGGLSLDLEGYRAAPRIIRRLLSVGVLVTWLATALFLWLSFGLTLSFSLLAASLVIVTGPTVIAPLLKRIRVRKNLHNILHWEGVLIDPIGVFIAILCFEWVSGQSGGRVLVHFFLRIAVGGLLGAFGGLALCRILKHRWVPDDMLNTFTVASALLIYGVTEALAHVLHFTEAGLLAVVVAGLIVGMKRPIELKALRRFKAEITELMIGMLFILLAARLEIDQIRRFGVEGVLAVAFIMFVVRPLNIAISSIGSGLSWKERLFLGWIAPRGIVAASMAALFSISLADRIGVGEAEFIETLTYSVIIATVVLQGFSAGPLASLLGLKREAPTGWLLIGANPFARQVAAFMARQGIHPVVLVDTNPRAVAEAKADGLTAIHGDARDPLIRERAELAEIGNLLAMTDNESLNSLVSRQWVERLGPDHVYRWQAPILEPEGTLRSPESHEPGRVIWGELPKPSVLSEEVARADAELVEVGAGDTGRVSSPGAYPLMRIVKGRVVIDPARMAGLEKDASSPGLYLVRKGTHLVRCLRPELFAKVDAATTHELFSALVDRVVEVFPTLPREAIIRELEEREAQFPTALGHGFAVPHAFCPRLASRICMVARVPGGIDMGAVDGRPVTLVFVILSPSGDPEGHLATLSELAKLFDDPHTRDALLAADDPADIFSILLRGEAHWAHERA